VARPKNNRGGARPGSGRKPLDPGAGKMHRKDVVLTRDQIKAVKKLDNSFSAALRRVIDAGLRALGLE